MTDQTAETPPTVKLAPGDIVAIETPSGTRHLQVTHARAPYPDVIRAIHPGDGTDPDTIAGGKTAFAAMVELSRSLAENPETNRKASGKPSTSLPFSGLVEQSHKQNSSAKHIAI